MILDTPLDTPFDDTWAICPECDAWLPADVEHDCDESRREQETE